MAIISAIAATTVGTLAAGAVVATAVGTAANMYTANKTSKNAFRKAKGLEGEIDFLENNMTEVINPWEGVTDLSGMATNLSGMATDLSGMATDLSGLITNTSDFLSNPMANLSVSTAAAEFQAEEADIALANTLDMLSATGASAGGATALAQAALQSKKGVAATISQQEKSNADKEARGAQMLQQSKMQAANRVQDAQFGEAGRIQNIQMGEASRIQNIQMGEAARLQQFGIAEAQRMQDVAVKGEMFMYGEERDRELRKLDRKTAQMAGSYQSSAQAKSAQMGALTAGIGGITSIASAGLSASS